VSGEITRRDVIKLGAAATLTTLGLPDALAAAAAAPAFFTPQEFALVDELSEMIIPTDDHSPGAKAAKAAAYIDARLAEAWQAKEKEIWRSGLKLVDALCQEMNGKPFLQSSADERTAVLTRMARNEHHAETPAETFFAELKERVVHAYYTSEIGIKQELEYKGNTYLNEFVGADVSAAAGSAAAGSATLSGSREIVTALNAPVGLQLWSLREYLPKDLPGTLAKVRELGFREVEGAGLWGQTAARLRAALDAAELRCRSAHMGFERLRDDPSGAFAEVKTLGAEWIVCPWIPHDKSFTRDDALKAAAAFNTFATRAAAAGLRFAYHCHGYEFVPSSEGTLFDTLAGASRPEDVLFQIDVFHALFGGADPAQLIAKHANRVVSLHLKDLKKEFPITRGAAIAPAEADVPVGSGQVDTAAVLRAAMKARVSLYYVEDESADPWTHIPASLSYLENFKG
jgi:sugar phosphate isomerase/epimerase